MIVKLRGKIWKQITEIEYRKLGEKTAIFIEHDYEEETYFKQVGGSRVRIGG